MPRFSESTRASYETPQLRRLAMTALLVLWPDGLTIVELSGMLNAEPVQLAQDIARYTDQTPDVWQEDCPEDCDDDVCMHARVCLHNPRAAERVMLDIAKSAGMGRRKRRSKYERGGREPRIPQVDTREIDLPSLPSA